MADNYSAKSSYYGIPIAVDGDKLMDAEQRRIGIMTDNLLQVGASIADNSVIEEGSYLEVDDAGSGYMVILNPLAGTSIRGTLRKGLAYSTSTISWQGLTTGNFYYLYLKYLDGMYQDSTKFETFSSLTPVSNTSTEYLFLATYDLTSGYPGIIDIDPFGKKYAAGLLNHIIETVDPHSSILTQTNLVVSGSLEVGLRVDESIEIKQGFSGSVSPLFELSHFTPTAPLFKSLGEFIIEDSRMTTQLSETGNSSFSNGKASIVGAVNENTSLIGSNVSAIGLNTSHRTGDGSDHANVALNDSHRASTTNPHATDLENIGSGTLSELNSAISDANLDDAGDSRNPTNHAVDHTNGTDDIQSATNAQKGLATSSHISDIESNNSHRASTTNPHATDLENIGSGTFAELDSAVIDANLVNESLLITLNEIY